jgi:hypothetical protein
MSNSDAHFIPPRDVPYFVTTGLDPVVHTESQKLQTADNARGGAGWIAGSSPAMTA